MVEHHLAKVGVAGSSPVFRSIIIKPNNFFYRTDFGAMNGSVKSIHFMESLILAQDERWRRA